MQTEDTKTDSRLNLRIQDPVEAAFKLGESFAASGMFGCTKVAQGQILALQCLASGLTPFEVTQTYHLLDGKLCMKADAMLGKYIHAGGKVIWGVRTAERVKARWVFRDNDLEMEVSMQELVASGVALSRSGDLKDTYRRHPRQMLTARLISEAVRLLAPDVCSGVYTPEEVGDFAVEKDTKVEKEIKPKATAKVTEPVVEDVEVAVLQESLPTVEPVDPEAEFKKLLGHHYQAALDWFKTSAITSLKPKVQDEIRNRSADLIKRLDDSGITQLVRK